MRRLVAVLPLVLLILVAVAPPAHAATRIAIDLTVVNGEQTFATSGDVICASGDAINTAEFAAGGPRMKDPRTLTFHVDKLLICEDGTISIGVEAKVIIGQPYDTGGWRITDATGAYAGLHGGGSLVGEYIEGGIIDHYTGMVNR